MLVPPFGILLVGYIVASGTLWFCSHLLAPVGYQVSLGRCLGAAVLITIADNVSQLLRPWIGDFCILFLLVVCVLIIRGVLWLPFWRSLLTTIIYTVVVGSFFLVLMGKNRYKQTAELHSPLTPATVAQSVC